MAAFLKCGDLQEGFARVRCPDCEHEIFVAFSCRQCCTCPSCHQKRTLLTAIHVAEDVCAPVAHRQVVLTIPKRLRVHPRFDRQLHGHPHIHVLITFGGFTPQGDFLELAEFDMERLLAAWRDAVYELYLAEEKIQSEVVDNMRSWEHSGFSVDQSVFLAAGDQAGIERLVQYMTRCPFGSSRLVKVSDTGQFVYQAEKQA
mgnify:FL=1